MQLKNIVVKDIPVPIKVAKTLKSFVKKAISFLIIFYNKLY